MGGSSHPPQPAGRALAGSFSALARRRRQGRGRPRSHRSEDRRHSGRGAGMIDVARPVAHFLNFTAMLRHAGFAVAPEQTMAWLAAIDLLDPEEIGDVHRAARATLAPPPERFAEFDALFDAHFLGRRIATSPPSEEAPLRAAEDRGVGREPMFGDETRESGAKATGAERLTARRFAPATEDDTLRRFARALPARAPRRRSYRWRGARGGPRV